MKKKTYKIQLGGQPARRRLSDGAFVGQRDTTLKVLDGEGFGFLAWHLRLWVLRRKLGNGDAVGCRFPCWGRRVSPGVDIQGRNPSPFGTCDGGAIGATPFLKASHFGLCCASMSPWTDVLASRCFRGGSCNVKSELLREGRGLATMTRGDPPWS